MDRIVVIGASHGGVHALRGLAARLPAAFRARILVVLHIGGNPSDAGPLPAMHVADEARLVPGRILVAAPDRHLLVVDGKAVASRGPARTGPGRRSTPCSVAPPRRSVPV